MRFWKFVVVWGVLMMAAGAAKAQEMEGRFAVRGGFYLGNDFKDGLLKAHLEGFEVGGDIPLVRKWRGVGSVNFAPTIVFGGSNRSGSDTDGNIYRLMVNVKHGFGDNGFYGGVGVGISFTEARKFTGAGTATGDPNLKGEFHDASGFTAQFLAGYIFDYKGAARTKPFVEIGYYAGSNDKLSGFAFNIGARF